MKVTEAIGRTLVELGVRHVFGLIGSGNYQLTQAMARGRRDLHPARHEGGAITMTDAFGRISGRWRPVPCTRAQA